MIKVLIVILSIGRIYVFGSCPALCDQKSCTFGLLLCSESGLNIIPDIPSQGITIVIIMNQRFDKPILTYKNLSRYGPEEINLKEMTLQKCGLRDIESESFSHLIHLTHLDLSQNDLRTIRPGSFKALNLKLLKLDGNKFLKLTKDSLRGLVVSSLSLSDCGLTELHFDSIREISGHLTKLNLSQNNLKTLSFRFFLLFRRLEELHLDRNQLKCDCHLRWLVSILNKPPHSQNSMDIQAKCSTPSELKGKQISTLPESIFECLIPSIQKISINILTPMSATISCIPSSQSDARVYWKHVNDKNVTEQLKLLQDSVNNASIYVKGSSVFDQYSCFVVNDNGNISMDLNIYWPPPPINSTQLINIPLDNSFNVAQDYQNKNLQYLFLSQFSLLEMLLSIASTFVITIVLFSIIYLFLSRKINFAKENISPNRSAYDGGIYSDIPVYDVPQIPSPHHIYPSSPSPMHSTQLIDFRTQRLIPANHH